MKALLERVAAAAQDDERAFRIQPEIREAEPAAEGGTRTLLGHFAVFNEWTTIESYYEGNFLERIAPGAFRQTFRQDRERMQCLYEHGRDFQLDHKPLGTIDELKEDERGAYYEVGLIDTDYNRGFIIPAAEAGLLGASFRFRVLKDKWDLPANGEDELPKRTLLQVQVFEFGPCPFPAYPQATAGLRSDDLALWRSLTPATRDAFVRIARSTEGRDHQRDQDGTLIQMRLQQLQEVKL